MYMRYLEDYICQVDDCQDQLPCNVKAVIITDCQDQLPYNVQSCHNH